MEQPHPEQRAAHRGLSLWDRFGGWWELDWEWSMIAIVIDIAFSGGSHDD
jgi:hypothetical protein